MITRHRRRTDFLPLVLLVAAPACASTPVSERSADASPTFATSVLADFPDPPVHLLDAMRGRIRGMVVQESETGCPRIIFRGIRSLQGENNPLVYVGGARAMDTCVLNSLSTADVERVEAYTSGVAPRPPYQAHPNGLIIVFLHQRAS